MEKDLSQMTKNACLFNKPGSQIYKDAKTLRKIFNAKKMELESGRSLKTQNKKPGQSLSAITAALEDEADGSDDENNEEDDEDEGPMRQLFDILYNTATTNGKFLCLFRLFFQSLVLFIVFVCYNFVYVCPILFFVCSKPNHY